MDCSALLNIIKLLEDGCLSSQSLEQITESLVKQTLKVISSKEPGVKYPLFPQLRALLENAKYLVHHNKGCFEHLEDVGFLDLISEAIHLITEGIHTSDMPEETQQLVDQANETVLALSDVGPLAKAKVVLCLLPNMIELLMCQNLTFLNRLEILKNINVLLEQCHVKTKDEFLKKSENQQKIKSLVHLIQTIGDYEFQVGTVECLMRLFPRKLRQHYATVFIDNQNMLNGFLSINDRDFETDCRNFLNIINAKSEDPNQGVYSIPCLTAYVGNKELRKPSDTSYSEFWVDFNIGSQRVTIFCEQDSLLSQNSAMDEDLWETVAVYKTDVQSCVCNEEEEGLIVLEIQLKSPVCDIYPSQHQNVKDNTITIEFSSDLELHVSHAVAQTFRAPEKAKKVSTVEQPLQISLKEVQETDSQQSLASAAPQKPYQSMRENSSQDGSSSRRRKVSVPSIPMCSPLIKADGSSARKTQNLDIPKKDNVLAPKQFPLTVKTAKNKSLDKDNELARPKTPVIKSKSKAKVKTPVVVVTPLEAKPLNKKGKSKQKSKKETEKSNETVVNDLIIPDSLPVEDSVQTDKATVQPQKVSTSFRLSEDSGIGGDLSAHNISEAAQTHMDKEDDRLSTQVEKRSDLSEENNFPNESGDGKNIKKDNNNSTNLKRINKENSYKNEIIVGSPTESNHNSVETKDIDSIPDSLEGHELDENRANDTVDEKVKEMGNKKLDKSRKDIIKKTHVSKEKNENNKKENKSKEKTVSLASLSKDNESLEELYKFDEIEMERNKVNDLVKNKTKSKKGKQNKSKSSKKTKVKSNKETAANETWDEKDFETSLKKKSKEPTRRSGRSSGKRPDYKDPDTSNITDLEIGNETSVNESPEKVESKREGKIDAGEEMPSKVPETMKRRKKKKDKKTKCDTIEVSYKPMRNKKISFNENEASQKCVEEDTNDYTQHSVDKPTISPQIADDYDVCMESSVQASVSTNKRFNEKNKVQKTKSKSVNSKKVKSKLKNNLKDDHSSSDIDRDEILNDVELNKKCPTNVKCFYSSEESYVDSPGSIKVKTEVNNKSTSKQYSPRGHCKNSKSVKNKNLPVSDDEDSSEELFIEEDDSYNARRYRLEVSQVAYPGKQNKQSSKKNKAKTVVSNKSSLKELDDNSSLSELEKKTKSKNRNSKTISSGNNSHSKKASNTKSSLKAQQKSQQGSYSNEIMSLAYKGKIGFAGDDPFDSITSEPTNNKSMTVQMTYSKSKTSYRLYDWSTETSIERKPGYDPYDFDSHWDNQSMQSERLNKKNTPAITADKSKKTKIKKNKSKLQQEEILVKSPISVYGSDSETNEDPSNSDLLVQDKETNKWHRRDQVSKQASSKHKPSLKKKECKEKSKSKVKQEEEPCMMMDTEEEPMELLTDKFEDLNETKTEDQEEEMDLKSFSEIMKEMAKEEKRLALTNIMTPKTPKTVEFADDNDFPKTPCTVRSSTRTPRIGSCRRKGYTPLMVSFVKTPQSAQISEKQDTDSEDEMEESYSQCSRKQQAERLSGRKERSSIDSKTIESDKSWIAERRSSTKKRNRIKTYKKAKPIVKKSQYCDENESDDNRSVSGEESNTQKLSCFTKALQELGQATEMSSSDEPQDEPNNNSNMEICSLPIPSYFSSHSLASNTVTPSGKLGEVSLDNQILSPVTPYKSIQDEDDIQVIQTQENYALSFNMEDQGLHEPFGYDKLMKRNLQTLLGDSGFASGPSSEVRPSRSTLKRKYPLAPEELSEDGTADSDSQSEKEEERSTFIPKKLFKSEDMFKTVTTPKTLSIYSDVTEETEMDMPFQTGISSFITAFGADIQKQFKAKRQKVEALTKETLKSTQKQMNQAFSVQHQHQSVLHDDYMRNIMFELSELTKDVDRLKEAEQKTEDFYKYQIKVLHDNEQSQRARIENMMKTHFSYKDCLYKARKQSVDVYKNLKVTLKKDMSSLEQKLIKDVQKQELMNVKRGLQNLF